MRKIIFRNEGQKNPNVQRVSERSITYAEAFQNRFMVGKLPRPIFIVGDIEVDLIGMKRIEQSAAGEEKYDPECKPTHLTQRSKIVTFKDKTLKYLTYKLLLD